MVSVAWLTVGDKRGFLEFVGRRFEPFGLTATYTLRVAGDDPNNSKKVVGMDTGQALNAFSATGARKAVGQRRHVTVLFADVSGSSEHAERLEAEDYADLLGQFREFARDIIPRHGGSIARLQGDGVLALFGFNESREDDGRRATEAALELHAAVAQLQVGSGAAASMMQLHSGIHAGLVLLIEGDIERGRFDVVGEVPNTASRLCSLAGRGEIIVSAETLGPQAHFFQVSAPQRVPIRGRSVDLSVVRVEGRAAIERRIDAAARRGVVPFAGRSAALTTLFSAADQTRLGQVGSVVIIGEAGIGKSRLIDEFQRRLDKTSFTVTQGYCESYLGAVPLQPFLQVIRNALGWRTEVGVKANDAAISAALGAWRDPSALALVPLVSALLGGPGAAVAATAAASQVTTIVNLIVLLAQQQPLVLILDDWQWADDASRQVLDALAERNLPMLVVLASRPGSDDVLALSHAQVLRLEPLESAEAQGAIAAWLPDSDPFVTQEIFRQSGGSPLFIEELCHAAAAGGDIAAAASIAPRGNGVAWINALVSSRLARLPKTQADCLRLAAVAGNVFSVSLLAQLPPLLQLQEADELSPLLEALAEQDFLVSAGQPGMLRFKHALTREAVYATVDIEHRRALHRVIGESLEASVEGHDAFASLEALAYHFDAASLSEKAVQFAEAAGDKALAAMALDRARAQFITALRALDNLPELTQAMLMRWCSIAQKLGQTCVFDPLDVSHGLVLFERAALLARQTGHENSIARAEYWLGYVNYGKGRPRFAVRHCEAALEHAIASDDQKLVAQIRATLGQSLASAGRYERALPLMANAVESKRQHSRPGSGTAIGSAYTLARRGYTFGDLGQFEQAHDCFAESLHLLGDKLHSVGASARELICAVHLWQGRWEEAYVIGMEGSDMAMRCRSRYLHAMGRALAACGGWAGKGDAESLQMLRESTQWIEARGGAVSTSLNYGWLVDAAVTLGLQQEARQHATRLFVRARSQDRHGEAQGCRALARLADSQGQFDRALHYLNAADKAADFRGSPRERAVNGLARAEHRLAAGDSLAGRALALQSADAFQAMKMAWHLDLALKIAQST